MSLCCKRIEYAMSKRGSKCKNVVAAIGIVTPQCCHSIFLLWSLYFLYSLNILCTALTNDCSWGPSISVPTFLDYLYLFIFFILNCIKIVGRSQATSLTFL